MYMCVYSRTAPTNPVNVTSVLRTEDNHSIVAYWEELQTTLPEGELVRYDVEYRDAPQGEGAAVSVVHVPAQYAFVVISGVENANSYEVCCTYVYRCKYILCMVHTYIVRTYVRTYVRE